MPIHLRKRGKIWHARGTVRVGKTVITVPQYSTGCDKRADAEAAAAAHEAELRAGQLAGPENRQTARLIDHAILAYLQRPGGVRRYDTDRAEDFSARIGEYKIAAAPEAWEAWKRMRAGKMAPGTVARWRAIYVAILAEGCRALNAGPPPKIPGVRQPTNERVVYLTDQERAALLAAYNPQAGRVALVLAYQGLRSQEALRLDWRHVDLPRGSLYVANAGTGSDTRTKTGRGRAVPLHPRVAVMLAALWEQSGRPDLGPVFLNRKNRAYADTRGKGGNPLSKAHASACRKAGIKNFRPHDWRHDWASRMVMAGVDLETLRKLGGWSSLRMVSRYAAVTADHMRDSIAKLA